MRSIPRSPPTAIARPSYSLAKQCSRRRPFQGGPKPALSGVAISHFGFPRPERCLCVRCSQRVNTTSNATCSTQPRMVLGSADVQAAFLNAPVATPTNTTILVRVPAILRAAGVCQEKYWRVPGPSTREP